MNFITTFFILSLGITACALKLEHCDAAGDNFVSLSVTGCDEQFQDICVLKNKSELYVKLEFKPHMDIRAGYIEISALSSTEGRYPVFLLYYKELCKDCNFTLKKNEVYKITGNLNLDQPDAEFYKGPVTIIIVVQGKGALRKALCIKFQLKKEM